MKRRTFLQTSAAATTLCAVGGALPAIAQPFEKKRMNVLGHEMAYVDEGSGRPVVFLHGNPTSSYLWRNIIPYVTDGHRAIAPDMMGMGDSDKPEITDTYAQSAEYLHTFLDSLDLQEAILVIHDWGSCLGWHYARTRPERIAGICFMEAMTPPTLPASSYSSFKPEFEQFLRTVKTPGVGEKLIMQDNFFIDQFLANGSPNGPLPEETMAEYNRYYPTAESRKIVLDWPREIPVGGDPANVHAVMQDNADWLPTTTFPKLMFHVEPGAIITEETAAYLKDVLPNLESVFLGVGGHFPQEDHADAIGRGLAAWLQRV